MAGTEIPDIQAYIQSEAASRQRLETLQAEYLDLQARMHENKKKLDAARQEESGIWKNFEAAVDESPELYAASFYLDDKEVFEGSAEIMEAHRRGAFFVRLSDMIRQEPVPVLGLNTSQRMISTSDGQYHRQGEAPQVHYTTFQGLLGNLHAGLEVDKKSKKNHVNGSVTTTLQAVLGPLADAANIDSVVGGWSYAYGDETWLEAPKLRPANNQKLVLLGTVPGWSKPHTIHAEDDTGEALTIKTLAPYDIYVGASVIARKIQELQGQPGPKDNHWLLKFEEHWHKLQR